MLLIKKLDYYSLSNMEIILLNLYLKFMVRREIKIFLILNNIIKDLWFYSNQKFSLNLIEKFFSFWYLKNKVISKIIEKENWKKLILAPYGNYVVQKALIYI